MAGPGQGLVTSECRARQEMALASLAAHLYPAHCTAHPGGEMTHSAVVTMHHPQHQEENEASSDHGHCGNMNEGSERTEICH